MIVCPACGHRNPTRATLCEACGRSLEGFVYRACPSCGALNAAQHVFCHRCFTELTLAEGENPIPESPFVRPFTPPAITLQETFVEVVRQAQEPSSVEVTSQTPTAPPIQAEGFTEAKTEPQPMSFEGALTEAIERSDQQAQLEPAGLVQPTTHPPEPTAERATTLTEEEQPVIPGEAPPLSVDIESNPLEGLDGLLSPAPAIELPHRPPRPAAATAARDDEAELFQQVAVERAPLQERAQMVLLPKERALPKLGRTVLYILTLLAGLSPFFTWGQMSSFIQPREAVLALARTVEELPSGAKVLLSFDYSPTYAGELDPLASAVVYHLARRSAQMIVMSTKPEGIGLAEAIYHTLSNELPEYRYGEDYAFLGYLPGQEVGLRSLNISLSDAFKVDYLQGRPLGELDVTSGLASLRDFDQIIVLADDSAIIQRWIEQVQSQSGIAFHALVTSAVEPLLVPYRQSGQLLSLIPGASGAMEYEIASAAEPRALLWSDAYAAFVALLLMVAIVTNALYASQRRRSK